MTDLDILVVDDEPHIARSLEFVFQKEGFSVTLATSGEEAWEKLQSLTPRIAFLDLVMPKGNGIELTRRIKSNAATRGIYVVILTCKGQQLDQDAAMAAGADEFLTKPFSPREVVARVRALLARG